ncbi:hypothetical protein NpNSSI1_00003901 [Neofusicoccum parvum]|nr:hypothetical protein NpNSSI1_00003901 [Neofusicoccum parvum]
MIALSSAVSTSPPPLLLGYTRDPTDPLARLRAQFPSLFLDDDNDNDARDPTPSHRASSPSVASTASTASTATLTDDDIFSVGPATSTIPTSARSGYYVDARKSVHPARRPRRRPGWGAEQERAAVLREVGSWVADAAGRVRGRTGRKGQGRGRAVVLHQGGERDERDSGVGGGAYCAPRTDASAFALPFPRYRYRRRAPDVVADEVGVGVVRGRVGAAAAATPLLACVCGWRRAGVVGAAVVAGLLLCRAVVRLVSGADVAGLCLLAQHVLLAGLAAFMLWLTARVMLAFRFTRLETGLAVVVEVLVGVIVVGGGMK